MFEGTEHSTFQEACKAHGLLKNDAEWHLCLADAAHMQTGIYLCYLFASMLLFCQLSAPHSLWAEFQEHLQYVMTC
jgi:hypothetical protein